MNCWLTSRAWQRMRLLSSTAATIKPKRVPTRLTVAHWLSVNSLPVIQFLMFVIVQSLIVVAGGKCDNAKGTCTTSADCGAQITCNSGRCSNHPTWACSANADCGWSPTCSTSGGCSVHQVHQHLMRCYCVGSKLCSNHPTWGCKIDTDCGSQPTCN